MPETHLALIVSLLSLIGTAVNMWLKLQIRLEVLQSQKQILDYVDERYVRKEVLGVVFPQIERKP
jgi:hypothetical protein